MLFKHCTAMAWQVDAGAGDQARSSGHLGLRALLRKFATADDGAGLAQLDLSGLQLDEGHCCSLSSAAVCGQLASLRRPSIVQSQPHSAIPGPAAVAVPQRDSH